MKFLILLALLNSTITFVYADVVTGTAQREMVSFSSKLPDSIKKPLIEKNLQASKEARKQAYKNAQSQCSSIIDVMSFDEKMDRDSRTEINSGGVESMYNIITTLTAYCVEE